MKKLILLILPILIFTTACSSTKICLDSNGLKFKKEVTHYETTYYSRDVLKTKTTLPREYVVLGDSLTRQVKTLRGEYYITSKLIFIPTLTQLKRLELINVKPERAFSNKYDLNFSDFFETEKMGDELYYVAKVFEKLGMLYYLPANCLQMTTQEGKVYAESGRIYKLKIKSSSKECSTNSKKSSSQKPALKIPSKKNSIEEKLTTKKSPCSHGLEYDPCKSGQTIENLYYAKKGDTAGKIALMFKLNLEVFAELNGLDCKYKIKTGQAYKIK